jgi:hypothetical protein
MGDSSYTVLRPGFSSHKALRDILSALTLTPEQNPLPGIKTRLHHLSLENELLEELRKESDEVREMLTLEGDLYGEQNSFLRNQSSAGTHAQKRIENQPKVFSEPVYIPVNKAAFADFFASLGKPEQNALKSIIQTIQEPADITETAIDNINAAFYEQFGDLLIETCREVPSISAEDAVILEKWE